MTIKGMSKGTSTQNGHNVKFPVKLMDALDDEYYDDCIRWSSDGLSLEIISPGATERKLLKEVFNGEKLHSFIRKIYKWGFVASPTRTEGAWKAFTYPSMFQRGQRELCRQMRRGGSMRAESSYHAKYTIKLKKHERRFSNNTNTTCSLSNGEEEEQEHEAVSFSFENISPDFRPNNVSADQISPFPTSVVYDIDEDDIIDDDMKELLRLALDDGIFE